MTDYEHPTYRIDDITMPEIREAAKRLQKKCVCGADFDLHIELRDDRYFFRLTAPNGATEEGYYET